MVELLKKVQNELGVSKTRFCSIMNISDMSYKRWEKGISVPSLKTMRKISKTLNIPYRSLVATTEEYKNTLEFDKPNLSSAIKMTRLLCGIGIEELAMKSKTSQIFIFKMEIGDFENVPIKAIIKVCNALMINKSEFTLS